MRSFHILARRPTRQNGLSRNICHECPYFTGKAAPVSPRFDRQIHRRAKLIERYVENKLPFKGARDLDGGAARIPIT